MQIIEIKKSVRDKLNLQFTLVDGEYKDFKEVLPYIN